RIPSYRVVFNLANHALCAALAGWAFALGRAFHAAGTASLRALGGMASHAELAFPIALAAGSHYLVNTMGTAAAVAWSQGLRLIQVWRQNFLWTAPSYFASASGATALVWVYEAWGFKSILLLMPLFYIIYHSYRLYTEKI